MLRNTKKLAKSRKILTNWKIAKFYRNIPISWKAVPYVVRVTAVKLRTRVGINHSVHLNR